VQLNQSYIENVMGFSTVVFVVDVLKKAYFLPFQQKSIKASRSLLIYFAPHSYCQTVRLLFILYFNLQPSSGMNFILHETGQKICQALFFINNYQIHFLSSQVKDSKFPSNNFLLQPLRAASPTAVDDKSFSEKTTTRT
jgi:hypothetical protein